MICPHCKGTRKCKESEFKSIPYEVWYECKKCGQSEHIKYGGFFESPSESIKAEAKSKEIDCKECNGKGELIYFKLLI